MPKWGNPEHFCCSHWPSSVCKLCKCGLYLWKQCLCVNTCESHSARTWWTCRVALEGGWKGLQAPSLEIYASIRGKFKTDKNMLKMRTWSLHFPIEGPSPSIRNILALQLRHGWRKKRLKGDILKPCTEGHLRWWYLWETGLS